MEEKMKKMAIFTLIILSVAVFGGCRATYDVFRLHIIANSDTVPDQSIKLIVRDEILKSLPAFESKEESEEYIRGHLSEINELANDILTGHGFEYRAQSYCGKQNFPKRTYANAVYPEGEYSALKIVLGEGSGQNWWCVIFPPLCIAPGSEEADFADSPKIKYKSAAGEFFENLFGGKQ